MFSLHNSSAESANESVNKEMLTRLLLSVLEIEWHIFIEKIIYIGILKNNIIIDHAVNVQSSAGVGNFLRVSWIIHRSIEVNCQVDYVLLVKRIVKCNCNIIWNDFQSSVAI